MPNPFTSQRDKGNCMRCKTTLKAGQLILNVRASQTRNIHGYIHADKTQCNKQKEVINDA